MHTIKPLDTATLDRIAGAYHTIIVLGEHIPAGGLWAAICSWHVTKQPPPRMVRLGAPDAFALGNLKQVELRQRWSFNAEAVSQACRDAWTY
jgi:transketolase